MNQKTIMLVDDSKLFQAVMADMMSRHGYRFLAASDYESAMAAYKAERPDLILMDVIMPGKDGLECTKHILSVDPDALILIVSANMKPEIVYASIGYGARDIIVKPVDEDVAVAKIQRALTAARTYDMSNITNKLLSYYPTVLLKQADIDAVLDESCNNA